MLPQEAQRRREVCCLKAREKRVGVKEEQEGNEGRGVEGGRGEKEGGGGGEQGRGEEEKNGEEEEMQKEEKKGGRRRRRRRKEKEEGEETLAKMIASFLGIPRNS